MSIQYGTEAGVFVLYLAMLLTKLFTATFFIISTATLLGQTNDVEKYLLRADSLIGANDTTAIKVLIEVERSFPNELKRSEYRIFHTKLKGDFYAWVAEDYQMGVKSYRPLVSSSTDKLDSLSLDRLAKGLNDMGILYQRMGISDSAILLHRRSIQTYQRIKSQQGLAYNYNNLAVIYRDQGKMDSTMYFFEKSRAAAEAIKDTLGVGYNYLNLAIGATNQEQLGKAIDYYNRALDIFQQGNYEKQAASTRYRMSSFYYRLGEYETALMLLRKALQFYERQQSKRALQGIYLQV
ncbi:MAG: tetratricopeptide repeat protein, partial [Bacteroidota bacterium]